MTAPHAFRPDVTGEPGYRPRCLDCGRERPAHVPAPRTPARQQNEKEQRDA